MIARRAGAAGGAAHLADARHGAPGPAATPLDARPDRASGPWPARRNGGRRIGLTEATAERGVEVWPPRWPGRPTDPGRVPGRAGRGRRRGHRAARLPPALVRRPARRHLHRPARRQGADLRAAGRVGARRRTGRTARRRWASSRCATSAATVRRPRQDFAGWTGLTVADARAGIAVAGEQLARSGRRRRDGAGPACHAPDAAARRPRWLALPGFDEYMLGYKDRSLMADRRLWPRSSPAATASSSRPWSATAGWSARGRGCSDRRA